MTFWLVASLSLAMSIASIAHLLALRKRPAATLAWMWAILLFPFIGTLVYVATGTDRLRRKRLRRRANFQAHRKGSREDPGQPPRQANLPAEDVPFVTLISRINHIPTTSADDARLLASAKEFYAALRERIDEAQHHVHIQFFIWRADSSGDKIMESLIAAAKRGVSVRVLIDEIGSVFLSSSYFKRLVEAGGEFSWFFTINPRRHRYLFNLRNHRKLQIIDGKIAFVGGMNVGREYEGLDPEVGPWRDCQIEVTGPIAAVLQESFADDWHFATQARLTDKSYYPEYKEPAEWPSLIVAGGPDSPTQPVQKSLVAMLGNARKCVWLTTGYFVPNDVLITALQLCAARGVDVRLLISEKTDHPFLLRIGRSYYEEMLRFGVRIFEYSRALNHSKIGLLDDDWLLVGSANIDNRSMRLNFELSLLLRMPREARRIQKILADDFADSTEIKIAEFQARSRKERVIESLCRPFAPAL